MKKPAQFHIVSSLCALTLCFGQGFLSADAEAGSVFEGTSANVWVLDEKGEMTASHSLNDFSWTDSAEFVDPTTVNVSYFISGGTVDSEKVFLGGTQRNVLVNTVSGSTPSLSVGVPDLSVAGLGNPVLTSYDQPAVMLSPAGGTFAKTIEVVVNGFSAPDLSDLLSVRWRINGGEVFCTRKTAKIDLCTVSSNHFFLDETGNYTVQYWAWQGQEFPVSSVNFSIIKPLDIDTYAWITRDTDGDGIPDRFEVEFGMNPLENDILQDSDGDGWTDFEEAMRGSDAGNTESSPLDRDWDGWSDFDEGVRGTNPYDPVMVDKLIYDTDNDGLPDKGDGIPDFAVVSPQDTDGDGLIDVGGYIHDLDGDGVPDYEPGIHFPADVNGDNAPDEIVYADFPTAGRLTEVEYLLAGQVYHDIGHTKLQPFLGNMTAMSVRWLPFYIQNNLPSPEDLDLIAFSEEQIPVQYRAEEAALALESGSFPYLRVPAGQPVILRLENLSDPTRKWVAKAWVNSTPDLEVSAMADWLASVGRSWNTANDWKLAYEDYLRDNLVRASVQVDMGPETDNGIALLENVVYWYSELSEGGLVLLGNLASPKPTAALDELLGDIGGISEVRGDGVVRLGRTLDVFHSELLGLTGTGNLLEGFGSAVEGYYANSDSYNESTTTRAASALARGMSLAPEVIVNAFLAASALNITVEPGALASYISRLLTVISLDELNNLPQEDYDRLTNPFADYDGDGIANIDELTGDVETSTLPTVLDTDGDGLSDALDNCPQDPTNVCGLVAEQSADDDSDTVINAFDNCRNTYNPDQLDKDEDGIGDACQKDWDGDTYNNDIEIADGSDPLNPLSIPEGSKLVLAKGFNIVSFPAEIMGYDSLYGLMEELNGYEVIRSVQVFDPTRQIFIKAGYDDDTDQIYGPDLPLGPGTGLPGLIIYTKVEATFYFPTTYCHEWNLLPGTNVVGSPWTNKTLKNVLGEIGDSSVVSSIQRFNSETGQFESVLYRNDGSEIIDGVDLRIQSGEGYFIFMKKAVDGFVP